MQTPDPKPAGPTFSLKTVFLIVTLICVLLAIVNVAEFALPLVVVAAVINALLHATISRRSRLVVIFISPPIGMAVAALFGMLFVFTANDRLEATDRLELIPSLMLLGAMAGCAVSVAFGVPLAVVKLVETAYRAPKRAHDNEVDDDSGDRRDVTK
jgi:hypothetical protein